MFKFATFNGLCQKIESKAQGSVSWIGDTNIYILYNFFNISRCFQTDTVDDAALAPLTATAGTPIPGKTESPQHSNPGISVLGYGNFALPASSAGPYVPLYLLLNRW